MVWQWIIALVLFFGGLIALIKSSIYDAVTTLGAVGGFVITFLGGGLLSFLIFGGNDETKPNAIDVYRDKTTLQITYKIVDNDTIDIDSCVVWKPEFNPNTKNE